MHVIIVGCGRVGASTAAALARAGHEVVVIDRNPDAFRLLPPNFSGRTLVGNAFDREVLEEAGIREADALVAVTSGDNTNAVAARVAKEVYRVPDVVSRIYDPQRAEIYRRYGVQTFAPTAWSASKIVELIVSPNLEREKTFGNGEVQLIAAWVPAHLVGKPVNDLASPARSTWRSSCAWAGASCRCRARRLEQDDQVYVVIHQSAVEKFQKMMGWK